MEWVVFASIVLVVSIIGTIVVAYIFREDSFNVGMTLFIGLGTALCSGLGLTVAIDDYTAPPNKREKKEAETIICASSYNDSGNVCRVKTSSGWCVAVLPDGGKSPRYKPDYITCPRGKNYG